MARTPDCHPDRLHWGGGKCKLCYQKAWWHSDARKNPTTRVPRKQNPGRTLWPQEIVKVPNMPKGWGYLG
jgi:hypothetical protein